MFKKLFISFAIICSFAAVFSAFPALAQTPACEGAKSAGVTECGDSPFSSRLNSIINAVFFIAGTAAVIVLLAGGIGYILSTGDATRITKAKNTILYAVIGLIIVILARAIVGFIVGRI